MIGRPFLRIAFRVSLRIALLGVATAATALADGSLPQLSVGPAFANQIEASLVRVILSLHESGLKRALDEIDKVVANHPNYRLAQLVKGDILMASAGRPVAFGATAITGAGIAPLEDEARARLQRYFDAPPVNRLPAALLHLAADQTHALVVDTSRSRLFVYANDDGWPRYVTDFYISLGKDGIDKQREGDQKTPIGVYRIVSSKDNLPDFYGPRAFPLSYPNDWDRMHGRRGHGIWLHGTPSETYSRAPWATDGCLVLTNDDLTKLAKYIDVSRTPVVIDKTVDWRDMKSWAAERDAFLGDFRKWTSDWESRDASRYFSHYSSRFRSDSEDLAAWKAHKRQVNAAKRWIKVGVKDLSFFAYPGEKDLMMVTFEQDYRSSNMSKRTMKRQYWVREGGHWRILHENVVS